MSNHIKKTTMKKMMTTLIIMLTVTATGKAMSYEQARDEALFLTDKMAYELNMSDEQYDAAYRINLDYLMGVTDHNDVYGSYLDNRNRALYGILLDWQWAAFRAATYFFSPVSWNGGHWHFAIHTRYPHHDRYYFAHSKPAHRPVHHAAHNTTHHASHNPVVSNRQGGSGGSSFGGSRSHNSSTNKGNSGGRTFGGHR